MPRDMTDPPETLPEFYLRMANGNERAALEAACATLEVEILTRLALEEKTSRGYLRWPARHQTMPPKKQRSAILNPDEQIGT